MDKEEKISPTRGSGEENPPQPSDAKGPATARDELNSSERIEALRTRLYERGARSEMRVRHSLRESDAVTKETPVIATPTWKQPQKPPQPEREPVTPSSLSGTQENLREPLTQTPMAERKRSRSYRGKIVLVGIIFFLLALGASSLMLFKGNNLISGENITIDVLGPLTIGGGEELQLQIAVSNQNAIPIESATLIIEYPKGTQSIDNVGKELFADRQQLPSIGTGEVLNIPVKARVFGEENEEKTIKVSVEYRVTGSNATFFKEATPLRFKISSSPVVLSVSAVKSITSGQEVEIELTVGSNAPATLTNVLVKATYPETGFDFVDAEPEAVSGQDTWLIKELAPESKKKIVIKGIVVGKQDEERAFTFAVGVPSDKNSYSLFSVFTTVKAEIALEQPFLDLGMRINNETSETVVITESKPASVVVSFNNSLDDTLYNGTVQVTLKGNALDDVSVNLSGGFYDSSNNTITWDSTGMEGLKEIAPGRTNNLNFTLDLRDSDGKTPEIILDVTAKAERVFEDRVPQELVGSITRTIRIEGGIELSSSAIYSDGPFVNSGPLPPVAEKVTTYTFLLAVDNGNNEITGTKVSAVLPQYMTWKDTVSTGDTVTYNPVTRTMEWSIGEMNAKEHEEVWVQVSFKPSLSQVGITPTILEMQRLKATDKFTGTTIRTDAPALTTKLMNDPNESTRDGKVQSH